MSLALSDWNTEHTHNSQYVFPDDPIIDPVGTPGTPTLITNMTVIDSQNQFVRGALQQGFLTGWSNTEKIGDWIANNKTLVYGAVGAIALLALMSGRR